MAIDSGFLGSGIPRLKVLKTFPPVWVGEGSEWPRLNRQRGTEEEHHASKHPSDFSIRGGVVVWELDVEIPGINPSSATELPA